MTRITAVLVLAVFTASAWAQTPAPEPLPEYEQLLAGARRSLAAGAWNDFTADVSKRIAETMEKNKSEVPVERVRDLFYFRDVAATFSRVKDPALKDVVSWLLDHRAFCGRFLHALDADDDLSAAVRILRKLRAEDERAALANQELCIAYAVVWDRYSRHSRFSRPAIEPDCMMNTYRYFNRFAGEMKLRPQLLPWELAVYVVDLSVTTPERLWALENYTRVPNIGRTFFEVPYTSPLSPALGSGRDVDYTLMNIRRMGGVCMEQAYFAGQVGKCLGVPSVYCHGEGKRGGHAWVGFLRTDIRPVYWDFNSGRYGYDHYWKGETDDPTNRSPRNQVPVSVVQLSAAILSVGDVNTLEDSRYLADAAGWAATFHPSESERGAIAYALLMRSLKLCPYNKESWLALAGLAENRRLTDRQTEQAAEALFSYTLRDFPDFTALCFERFLHSVKDLDRKTAVLSRAFRAFSARPDLAAEMKVLEGDLLLSEGKTKEAVVAYCWPLAEFPGEGHVMGSIEQRLTDLSTKVRDRKELAGIYDSMLQSIVRNSANQSEGLTQVFSVLSTKLAALYRELGQEKDAVRVARASGQWLAGRPRSQQPD